MKRLLTLLSMSMCFLFMVAENASMKITTIDGETTTLNLIDTTIARYIYSEDHTQLIIQVTEGYFIYDEMQEIIRSRNIELWGEKGIYGLIRNAGRCLSLELPMNTTTLLPAIGDMIPEL